MILSWKTCPSTVIGAYCIHMHVFLKSVNIHGKLHPSTVVLYWTSGNVKLQALGDNINALRAIIHCCSEYWISMGNKNWIIVISNIYGSANNLKRGMVLYQWNLTLKLYHLIIYIYIWCWCFFTNGQTMQVFHHPNVYVLIGRKIWSSEAASTRWEHHSESTTRAIPFLHAAIKSRKYRLGLGREVLNLHWSGLLGLGESLYRC